MKTIYLSLIGFSILIISACSSSKKSTVAATSVAAPVTPPAMLERPPATGIFAPGNEELTAIQAKYKDATMQNLTEGHAIYTGVCINCHAAKSIYSRSEGNWPAIIDNMAFKAKITDAQKDAVLKYVLAIKATQPK